MSNKKVCGCYTLLCVFSRFNLHQYFARAHREINSNDHKAEKTAINTGIDSAPPSSSIFNNTPVTTERVKQQIDIIFGCILWLKGINLAAKNHISQVGDTANKSRRTAIKIKMNISTC